MRGRAQGRAERALSELPPVVVISGKNPVAAPGGYAAYAHNLCAVLHKLGRSVHIVALGSEDASMPTDLGTLHLVRNEVASRIPFIADVQMTALALYSVSFARRLEQIAVGRPCVIWGLGPWGLGGAIFKTRRSPASRLVVSYFTTFLHEMRGSLEAIRVRDYGVRRKLAYAGVVGVIGPAFRSMERFLLQHAEKIVTHYASTEAILADEMGVSKQRFHRMTYYVETFERPGQSPVADSLPRPLIVTVCRQDPRKGINFLLHAIALLVQRGVNAHCLIAGGGSMLEPNRRLAGRLGIADRVTFAGFVGDVKSILEAADVFAFPAVEEGSGSLSVLEAMSVGAPMVVADTDGLSEDVQHGYSALVVPRKNPAALADALQTLLGDRPLARRLGQSARDAYRHKFSIERMERDVEALLQTLDVPSRG